MGTPGPGDPFDWTVDQVVSYLCNTSPVAWSKSSAPTARPDPATFGKALQENDVNGEILLTEISKTTLQQDLGVKSLGQRSSIFNAVQQLRQQSTKYQQHHAASQPTIHPSPQMSLPPHLSRNSISPVGSYPGFCDQTSHTPPLLQNTASMRPPTFPGSAITPSPFWPADQPPQHDLPPEFSQTNNTGRKLPESGLKQMEQSGSRILKRSPADTTRAPELLTNSTNQSRSAQREQHVIDDRGRKRRRLNLGPPVAENAATNTIQRSYIGREKVSATDIFYKSSHQDDDEDNFLVTKSDVPTGKRLFVNKLMKHYLQQQPSYLGVNGRKQILGVMPYPRKFSQLGEKYYFTLFTPAGKKIQVSKEEVDQWPQLRGDSSLGSSMVSRRPPPENDPYGRFLWRYAHEDDREVSLPPLGESGSEGGYDSDTWNEMEEEKQMKDIATELQDQTDGSPKCLSTSEVNATIDDCLDTFSKNWDSNKLPVENRKAWHFWMLSRKKKTRKQQISDAKISIDRLRKRLDRIRERILDEQWTKVTELQTQCQCMEPSISDIKKEEWKISVLELSSCPLKPERETAPRKRVKKSVQLYPEQEESLDSDSEGGFDDNLEDFILPDTATAETRPEDEMDIAPSLEDDENQKDNSQPLPSLSDSEEGIVGPMVYKRRRRLRRSGSDESQRVAQSSPTTGTPRQKPHTRHTRRRARSSNQKQLSQEDVEIVDLTQVDESPNENEIGDTTGESGDIITPPLNPTTSPEHSLDPRVGMEKKSSSQSPISLYEENQNHSSLEPKDRESQSPPPPDLGDLDGISKLTWKYLEGRQDKRRLLRKLIVRMFDEHRDLLKKYLPNAPIEWFQMHAKAALECLLANKRGLHHLTKDENKTVMRVSTLFIAWVKSKKQNEKGLHEKDIEASLLEFGEFNDFFNSLLSGIKDYYAYYVTTNNPGADDDSELHGVESEIGAAANSTPRKKRKKTVKQSQEVIHTQKSGQKRVIFQQIQQSRLARKMESMGVSNNDPERQAVSFESPVIYLDPHIGRRVKPHQLGGIQFMWREIMTDEKGTGCLLAHTMGLGKTMQV